MILSSHAASRASHRSIGPEELALVLNNGTMLHNGGALFVFMGRKDIPASVAPAMKERIEGITIVADPVTLDVITVYKNRQAIRDIKRKWKSRRGHRRCTCAGTP